jgi:hypothetical protein
LGGWLAAAVCGGQGVAAQEVPAKPIEGKIHWLYRYAEGQQQARTSGKPLFVVFRCER